jgi:hypothetical protein
VRVNDPHGGRTVARATLRVDGSQPVLTRLWSSKRTIKAGRSVKIDFRLSEAAMVRLTVRKARPGRRVRGACLRTARRGKRCTLLVQARTLRRAGHAGSNKIVLRSRGLKPGRFKVSLTAVDEVGHRSLSRGLWLRVVKR